MSSELSGVRSSWLMFARNSLLYFDESASCSAFSSSSSRAVSTSVFFCSMRAFCSSEQRRLLLELPVRPLELVALRLELLGLALQLEGEALRLLQELFRPHRGEDRVQHDAERFRQLLEECQVCVGVRRERRQLDHRHHLVLEEDGEDDDVDRRRLAEPGGDRDVVLRRLRDEDRFPFERGLPDDALAEAVDVGDALALLVGIAGDQLQLRLGVSVRLCHEERAELGADEWCQLAHDQAADCLQVTLPLEQTAEARHVRVQPVLLRVDVGRARAGS